MRRYIRVLEKASRAAVVLSSLVLPACTQEKPVENNPPIQTHYFQEKSWTYKTDRDHEYKISLLSPEASSATSVQDAIKIVINDDLPSVILAGDFADQQVGAIKAALMKLCAKNPKLVSHLEPVIIKMQEGYRSSAGTNLYLFHDFDGVLTRFGGNKSYDEILASEPQISWVDSAKSRAKKGV